jgi:predicted N-formylglutamate amidohydrolase
MIEIRQDEIRDTAAAATWAARLADAYRQIETEALKIWRS